MHCNYCYVTHCFKHSYSHSIVYIMCVTAFMHNQLLSAIFLGPYSLCFIAYLELRNMMVVSVGKLEGRLYVSCVVI